MNLCPVFQGLATSLALYKKEPTKDVQRDCEHQLDLLLTLSSNGRQLDAKSKSIIFENDVILSGLTGLIDKRSQSPHLIHKSLLILGYLAADKEILRHLCAESALMPRLARFLEHSLGPVFHSSLLQSLRLLQIATYKLTVICPNGFVEDILDFSVQSVVSESPAEFRVASLEILSNLAYANVSVQAYLKGLSGASALNRMLICNMKDESLVVIILSLSVLSSLWLNEDLGMRIFNEKNIEQTFQLIFKLVSQSPDKMEDSHLVVRSAVDLFCSVTQAPRIQHALGQYEQLPKYLLAICKSFSSADANRASMLLQLLLSLCSIEKTTNLLVKTVLYEGERPPPSSFLDILGWIGQPLQYSQSATFLAIDFLRELFEVDPGPPGLTSQLVPALAKQLGVGISCVRAEESEASRGNLYLTKLVKLLHLIDTVSKHHTLLKSLSDAISHQTLIDLYTFLISSTHSLFGIQDDSKDPSGRKPVIIQLLLATIKTLATFKEARSSYGEAYRSVLEDPRVLPYLSFALTQGERREVVLALELLKAALQTPNFHLSNFGNLLASYTFSQREHVKQLTDRLNEPALSQPAGNRDKARPSGLPPKLDSDSVEHSIERFRSGLLISEMRNSDIVDIYEYKLSTVDTKTTHLEALLEAKSLSLQQSERLAAQLRCKLADSERECQNLSNSLTQAKDKLLKEEGEVKSLAEREKELAFENESLLRDVSGLKEVESKYLRAAAEAKDRSEMCEKLEEHLKQETALARKLQKSNEVLEVNIESLKSQQDRLFEQVRELDADKQKHKQRLVEREKSLKELEVRAAQSSAKSAQTGRQLAETIAERDALAKQASSAQKSRESLQERVNELQSENIRINSDLQIEIEEQKLTKAQLEKMQQLAAMIHNLSRTSDNPESPNLLRKITPNE